MVYLCGRPLRNRGRCTLGRETAIVRMEWGEDGWLRTVDGTGFPSSRSPAPDVPAHAFPAPRGPIRFRRRHAADRLPVAALAAAGGALQPERAAGAPAALRPRDDRQPLPPGAGRAAAAGALLQRVHGGGLRARALPADGGPRLLLRRQPSSITSTSRTTRPWASTCAVMSALPDSPQADAFTRQGRDSGGPRRAARRGGRRADVLRLPPGRRRPGSGCRSSSTPASSPTRRRRRACPISPARSSAWPARTWRARRATRTSTGSSTASARSWPIRAPEGARQKSRGRKSFRSRRHVCHS